jgi:hypothetical protein
VEHDGDVEPQAADYRSHGVPLEAYRLTGADHRAQRDLEEMWKSLKIQVAKFPTRISDAKARRLASLLGRDGPAPRDVRWRVRLYCGHIIEVTRNAGDAAPNESVCRFERCASCAEREQMIVAYEPMGLVPGRQWNQTHIGESTRRDHSGRCHKSAGLDAALTPISPRRSVMPE